MPTPTPNPAPIETLLGGSELTVTHLGGITEMVRVRQLPIRDYPRLLDLALDEPRKVELLCDRPEGWADRLTLESAEAVIEEGDRLNADFFGRWFRRRIALQERLMPGALAAAVASRTEPAPSPTPSPTSPPPPGFPSAPSRT